jgi:hypothetical protein
MRQFDSLNDWTARQIFHGARKGMLLVLGLGLLLAVPSSGQNAAERTQQLMRGNLGKASVDSAFYDQEGDYSPQQERLQNALNADRQKKLIADTNKLVKLATELHAELSGTNSDALTPAQLHEVAEVEKLARNVKKEMSDSVRAMPISGPAW